jgi:hypothetical protein
MVDTIEVETVTIEMDGVSKEVEVPKKKSKAPVVEVAKPEPKPEPKPRTCMIEIALPASVIQLIKAAPHNDTVRAVILAHLKIPVPDECKTFEDIKEWIETTVVIPMPSKSKKGGPSNASIVEIPIQATDTEHGRCNYSIGRNGSGNYQLSVQRFRDMVESSQDLDDLVAALSDRIGDDWDQYIRMNPNEDEEYSYDDHGIDDDEPFTDREWDYQSGHRDVLRRLVAQFAPEYAGRF